MPADGSDIHQYACRNIKLFFTTIAHPTKIWKTNVQPQEKCGLPV
jgi:hypothetical protein